MVSPTCRLDRFPMRHLCLVQRAPRRNRPAPSSLRTAANIACAFNRASRAITSSLNLAECHAGTRCPLRVKQRLRLGADEIILRAAEAVTVKGKLKLIADAPSRQGTGDLEIDGAPTAQPKESREIYPAQLDHGRKTTGTSEIYAPTRSAKCRCDAAAQARLPVSKPARRSFSSAKRKKGTIGNPRASGILRARTRASIPIPRKNWAPPSIRCRPRTAASATTKVSPSARSYGGPLRHPRAREVPTPTDISLFPEAARSTNKPGPNYATTPTALRLEMIRTL